MASLYIHVPFCRSRCAYCDFFSTTSPASLQGRYAAAVVQEMAARRAEAAAWGGGALATVYFGGGTPSLLPPGDIAAMLTAAQRLFGVERGAEITLEANPDDVTPQRAAAWRSAGVNRVSLGAQSFDDAVLRRIGRRHTAQQVGQAVATLRAAGIENLSVDLIYGLPLQNLAVWRADVRAALALPVQHLSAYALTVESATPLGRDRAAGRFAEASDEAFAEYYDTLVEQVKVAGFDHYEISNFARPGHAARHNSAYWSGAPYLGLGPGAHSYDGHAARRANHPDLAAYLLSPAAPPHSVEQLSPDEQHNDYVFTALRTRRGLSLPALAARFGEAARREVQRTAQRHIARGLMQQAGERISLSERGVLISNDILSDFMRV